MKDKRNVLLRLLAGYLCGLLLATAASIMAANTASDHFAPEKLAVMERYVRERMGWGHIPGATVVIVSHSQVYFKGFGYADITTKRPVDKDTLFELGSTSKAFTALGILRLQEDGLLDVRDNVRKYLPWFKMFYIEKSANPTIEYLNRNKTVQKFIPWLQTRKTAEITIAELLRHSSGIRTEYIADIMPGTDAKALERTVRNLVGKDLEDEPGRQHVYSTLNYDVLGLIIQEVSGLPFETYMKLNVLEPLGLKHTYILYPEPPDRDHMSAGHKLSFWRTVKFTSPVYRGNAPAGYFITNAEDLTRWLRIQLGEIPLEGKERAIIEKSHQDPYGYSFGWNVYRVNQRVVRMWHTGGNNNFAAYIEFRPEEKVGVGVLLNLNSYYHQLFGEGILNIITGKGRVPTVVFDLYQYMDIVSILLIATLLFTLYISSRSTRDQLRNNTKFVGLNRKNLFKLILWIATALVWGFLIYFLPYLLFQYSWQFALIWSPYSFPVAIGLLIVQSIIGFIYYWNVIFYKCNKPNRRKQFSWRNLFQEM